ncbi:NDP-sugar synthase [Rhodoferax sp.]|jgi:MurNAc alpha-1-phosphate uridylyltransferase|uniref:NDP-sugar synthase n=1 Tax=Rhodoferax sp. TaxID=50421 RepID=UPI0037840FA1
MPHTAATSALSSPKTAPTPARALLLAAGRGERMRPLTDHLPKPLLAVHGKPLLQWQVEALAAGGFGEVVANTAWLGEKIEQHFGSALRYSHEGQDFGFALETAGGISRALPLLADVFWVAAGDVYAPDFVFGADAVRRFQASSMLAHLWLVPNPEHNPRGDFGLDGATGLALNLPPSPAQPDTARWTYSTIGLYRNALFFPPWTDIPPGNPQGRKAALAPLLRAAMDHGRVSAELYTGHWTDVGTPHRLEQLNAGLPLSTQPRPT